MQMQMYSEAGSNRGVVTQLRAYLAQAELPNDGRLPPERAVIGIREWLESLEVPSGSATPLLAAFDTHATRVRWSPWSASSSIAKVAVRRGLGCDARLGLVVDDVAGPLVDGERESAVDVGAALAARCRSRTARPG